MSAVTHPSPLLDRHGAVEADGPDTGLVAHYGQPVREQRALQAGRAVVDLSTYGVVTVSGEDRLTWLTTLSSQQVNALAPGSSAELLLLDISGRIEHAPAVVDDGTTTWLITEAEHAPRLAAWLDSMRFTLRVEVADLSAEVAVLGSAAPLPVSIPGEWNVTWQDSWPAIAPGGVSYAAVAEEDHPGQDYSWQLTLLRMDQLISAVDAIEAAGWTVAGVWAAEALRIAAWRPRLGREVDAKSIPHELDLMRTAVHLTKGCYRGQETVARVHNLGHPPRRLVFLHLDGSEHTLPSPGSEVLAPSAEAAQDHSVLAAERAVGVVTSVARHHEAGPIALAVVKRRVDPTQQLVVRDAGGAVDAQVDPGADAASGGDAGPGADASPSAEAGSSPTFYAAAQEPIVRPDAGQAVGRPQGDFLRGRPR